MFEIERIDEATIKISGQFDASQQEKASEVFEQIITSHTIMFDGLDYLPPEPVREAAVPVIAHRLGLEPQARYAGRGAEDIVRDCLERVPVPI